APDGMPDHARQPDRASVLVDDGDGNAARCLKHDGIGGFALPEQVLALLQLAAFHVGSDPIESDLAAEFFLQPALESIGRALADLVVHKPHVLAPFNRLVAAVEQLMRPRTAEEARLLEAELHRLA